MNRLEIDGRSYMRMPYRHFYANNLSEYGVCVFEYTQEYVPKFEKYLQDKIDYLGNITLLVLRIYNQIKQTSHFTLLLINRGNLSPFAFFNEMRFMCNRFGVRTDFYACDYNSDRIYKTNVSTMNEIGTLNLFPKILKLDEDNVIILPFQRWAPPKGYYYFSSPKVFRNDADRDFYTYKQIVGEKYFDTYYSLDECKDKLNTEENSLNFDRDSILEFDIDEPSLSLSGICIKARSLNIKDIKCEDLFCDDLTCQTANCDNILSDKLVAENVSASVVKTNYKYGVRLKSIQGEENEEEK